MKVSKQAEDIFTLLGTVESPLHQIGAECDVTESVFANTVSGQSADTQIGGWKRRSCAFLGNGASAIIIKHNPQGVEINTCIYWLIHVYEGNPWKFAPLYPVTVVLRSLVIGQQFYCVFPRTVKCDSDEE